MRGAGSEGGMWCSEGRILVVREGCGSEGGV